ncbi:MAG TPA: F0F1 ATP synthase subunit B [Stellaceae bacterium]|nr:F0F1 ATP synthase subunit B [Stellaceae bacterium]
MAAIVHDPEFWLAIAVLIFIGIVWRPAKRMLIGGLDARTARIRQELDAAQHLREEAERTLAEYQRKQREGLAEAEAIIDHAKTEAERIAAQSARDLEESLQRRRRLAEERIAQQEARALAEIRLATVDVAISAARRVIAAELDEKRGAELIDAGIAELSHQLQ